MKTQNNPNVGNGSDSEHSLPQLVGRLRDAASDSRKRITFEQIAKKLPEMERLLEDASHEIERLEKLALTRLIDLENFRQTLREKAKREAEIGAWILENYGHNAFAKMLHDTSNAKAHGMRADQGDKKQ